MFLANNLKYLRKKAGLSQEYIARLLGYKSFTTIQKWESGVSEPSITIVDSLCELYNVSLDDIIYMDISVDESNQHSKDKSIPLRDDEATLLGDYNKLNNLGKDEAIKRVSELSEIDKYTTNFEAITMAAHNDDESEEQLELMKKDFEEMSKW